MIRRKKILVIGSKGFIGSNLVPVLKKKYRVTEYDIEDGNDIFDDNLGFAIATNDVVIHLAALTSVSESFKNKSETHRVNVIGTARVVELCMKHKKKLIYPSSASVYVKESSPYAYSKYLAEEIVAGAKDKIPVVILRLFNVFGEGMNERTGSIMYNFLTDKNLVIFGDGEQTRDFIHVRDVVAIMNDAIKNKWNGFLGDIATGEEVSINYVAQLFKYYKGIKEVQYKIPRKEIRWSKANVQSLNKIYREKITTHLEHDIEKLCQK